MLRVTCVGVLYEQGLDVHHSKHVHPEPVYDDDVRFATTKCASSGLTHRFKTSSVFISNSSELRRLVSLRFVTNRVNNVFRSVS